MAVKKRYWSSGKKLIGKNIVVHDRFMSPKRRNSDEIPAYFVEELVGLARAYKLDMNASVRGYLALCPASGR